MTSRSARPASDAFKQRINRADQPPGRRDIDLHDPFKHFGFNMADGRDDAENRGIGKEYVELAPALVDRAAQPVNARHVGKIERHERRAAARRFDLVIQLFKPALRAGNGDDMRALPWPDPLARK